MRNLVAIGMAVLLCVGIAYARVELKHYNFELGKFVAPEEDIVLYPDALFHLKGTRDAIEMYFDQLDYGSLKECERDLLQLFRSSLAHTADDERVLIQPLGGYQKGSAKDEVGYWLCYDTCVFEAFPDSNFGNNDYVSCGCYSEERVWALLKAYECPSGTVVEQADDDDMDNYVAIDVTGDTLDEMRYWAVVPVTADWDEYSVTWNTMPGFLGGTYTFWGWEPGTTGYIPIGAFEALDYVCNQSQSDPAYGFYILPLHGLYPDDCGGMDAETIGFRAFELNDECASFVWITYITDVELSEFTATGYNGKVVIRWATSSETDNAGWNIYRAVGKSGEYAKINESMIAPYQFSYEYIDSDVEGGVHYCYKLEAVDLSGATEEFGPVCATPKAGAGVETGSTSFGDDDDDDLSATGGCSW